MATLTITISDGLADWIEGRVQAGDYASANHYLAVLVANDRQKPSSQSSAPLSIDDLRRIVDDAEASGISDRNIADIVAEGDRIARERGIFRD
ncbi:ribbon-helix-helix domain-containing protein [Antarcticirhabdus aurantiaca]|uniref:Type II toxin-antitoxin system ParD family antitoxin n=1 Tax=Antarcticirhabdus aurantiaca TaxID=2606717 RepID=A0ACD4NHE5_9HYPH|nr:type II toxin-antitoxin system ParD family antitoxin [Antarcticirhabdus aurantiaca]WAJ26248.1 type II toxin-antitoxin system ParD family antitoxin [Jeongeuplla avenae]